MTTKYNEKRVLLVLVCFRGDKRKIQNENNEKRERNDNKRVIKWMDLTGETDLLKRSFKINGNCSDFYYNTEVFQTFQFALSPPSLSSSLLIQIMNKNCINLSSF